MVYPSKSYGNVRLVKGILWNVDSRYSLDQKSSFTYAAANRTANQHRCSGRVDQDLRENLR